ncbi:MAG: hypothetical protein KC502_10920 [Myxococcales bacterium]|nr:hypothetical protein [Myxococcales bacterium]
MTTRPTSLLCLLLVLPLAGCPKAAPEDSKFATAADTDQHSDGGQVGVTDGGGSDTGGQADTDGVDTIQTLPDTLIDTGTSKPDTLVDTGTSTPDTSQTTLDTAEPKDSKDAANPACVGDKDCDDGNPCTGDQCTAGKCEYVKESDWTSCGVGKQCAGSLGCVHTVRGSAQYLTLGTDTTCATTADSRAWCWGRNDKAQVGIGSKDGGAKGVIWPTRAMLGEVKDIAQSWEFGCAVLKTGTLQCWGSNSHGQLGAGDSVPKLLTKPYPVKTTEKFDFVALGTTHGCALRSDGTAFCWGIGTSGQLGDGKGGLSNVPVKVIGMQPIEKLTLGEAFTCALDMNGKAWCWGANYESQLGNGKGGASQSSKVPVEPTGLTGVVSDIDAGRAHTCALTGGDVWCWGRNKSGQIGNGSSGLDVSKPAKVFGLTFKPDNLAVGGNTSCAYKLGGKVACWGSNSHGQIKSPATTMPVKEPTEIPGLIDVTDVAVGPKHICALISGKQVACWGDNYSGQLGVGPGVAKSTLPKIAGQPAP